MNDERHLFEIAVAHSVCIGFTGIYGSLCTLLAAAPTSFLSAMPQTVRYLGNNQQPDQPYHIASRKGVLNVSLRRQEKMQPYRIHMKQHTYGT